MGKRAPKGRAAAKKKAQKGGNTPNSSPWQNKSARGQWTFDDDDDDAYDYKSFRGFSQNNNNPSSSRTFAPQASNVKLRHQTISFVAAGSTTPLEFRPKPATNPATQNSQGSDEDDVIDPENFVDDAEDSVLQTNIETDVEISEGGMAQMNLNSSGDMSEQETGPSSSDLDMAGNTYKAENDVQMEEDLFVVDTVGDDTLVPKSRKSQSKQPARRARSPSPSDSSDEEVVFSGRANWKAKTIEDPVHAPKAAVSRAPQKAQQAPPRADQLAAWNKAARDLPQQNTNRSSSSVHRSATPPQDTIKETFKKTSGASSRLGGPRKYEVTEHTVRGPKPAQSSEAESSAGPPGQLDGANDETPHVADDLLKALSAPVPPSDNGTWESSDASRARGWGASPSKADSEVNADATWAPAPAGAWWRKKAKQARPDLDMSAEEKAAIDSSPPKVTRVAFAEPGSSKQPATEVNAGSSEEIEEGSQQALETLKETWKQQLREKKLSKLPKREADKIALDSPKTGSKGTRRKRGARKRDNAALRATVDSDDDDGAGEAAYDDYMANLAAQADGSEVEDDAMSTFARSNGLGGPSMMVDGEAFGEGEKLKARDVVMSADDDDEWESDTDGPIGEDVTDLSSDEERLNYSDISDSSELEDALNEGEREMWEDEEDLRERRKQAMADEQLAHLLAKQQEFGLDDDELILDDGYNMDDFGDVDEARAGLVNMTILVNGNRRKSKGTPRRKIPDHFPSATALADTVAQYGDAGFDIMDFERPSLRPTKKGRKGQLPAELAALSDDDLKDSMSAAWDHDRAKKRLKKAEREELRAQGMLGAAGKKGKADLTERYKYQDGMSPGQIIEELKVFLLDGGQASRPFPPMDAFNRKRLHEVAHALGLKSKSVGAGKSRFPVLYKTGRTVAYDEGLFADLLRANRDGSKNLNVKFAKRAAKRSVNRKGGGGGVAAASVGHGEVVGAGAPAMGQENKGFKFMRMMGWTPGMSLGREGEGRLVPVEQVVRVGRAGLG